MYAADPLSLVWTIEAMHVNVTLRRVRATIAAVEKQKVLHVMSVCL